MAKETAAASAAFDFGGGTAATEEKVNKVGAAEDNGSMVFDLTDTPEKIEFEVMPKGPYEAVVDSIEFGASKSNNPMITIQYAIVAPGFEKRTIKDYWVLRGNGAEFGQAKLKAFLVRVCPEVQLGAFDPASFCESAVAVGRSCVLELGIRTQKEGEYKGEKQNTIKEVRGASNQFGL